MWCATVVTAVKQSFFGLWATSIASFLTPSQRTSFWKTCEFALKNMATTTQVEVLAGAPQPNVVLQMVKSSILKGPNLCWKAFTAACWRKSLLRENFEWLVIRNHFGNYFTEIYHRVAASTLGKCIWAHYSLSCNTKAVFFCSLRLHWRFSSPLKSLVPMNSRPDLAM